MKERVAAGSRRASGALTKAEIPFAAHTVCFKSAPEAVHTPGARTGARPPRRPRPGLGPASRDRARGPPVGRLAPGFPSAPRARLPARPPPPGAQSRAGGDIRDARPRRKNGVPTRRHRRLRPQKDKSAGLLFGTCVDDGPPIKTPSGSPGPRPGDLLCRTNVRVSKRRPTVPNFPGEWGPLGPPGAHPPSPLPHPTGGRASPDLSGKDLPLQREGPHAPREKFYS